jgi:hypothetical protein
MNIFFILGGGMALCLRPLSAASATPFLLTAHGTVMQNLRPQVLIVVF